MWLRLFGIFTVCLIVVSLTMAAVAWQEEPPPFVEADEVTYEPMPVEGKESAFPISYRPGGINVIVGGKLLLAVTPEGAIECYDSTSQPEPYDCTKTLLAYMVAKEMER